LADKALGSLYSQNMKTNLLRSACVLAAICLGVIVAPAAEEPKWFKGNTHTHSLWSDGDDFPEMIARYYKEHGYNFLILSDHNTLSRGEKWMKVDSVEARRKNVGTSALDKYLAAFGPDWVELRGEGAKREVRLRTLAEIRPKFEEPGKFLFIEGEEITDSHGEKQVHINAGNLDEVVKPRHGDSVRAVMRNNLRAVQEQGERLGRPVLAHLNHPNYKWSLTGEDLAHVAELKYFEVYNGHPHVHVSGDEKRPGTEKLWDIANTLRMAVLKGEPLCGIASDDSHTYHGGDVRPGRGWVMVRAARLSADALIHAMEASQFYSSTGVTLDTVSFDDVNGILRISIAPVAGEIFTTRIHGTRRGAENDPAKIGEALATFTGPEVVYTLKGDEWYVRATITSDRAHPDPSYTGMLKQAWTQPVWLKKAAN
jgi:hypothetical protein